ncbi:hypothetical protein CO655_14790 [Rhizobium sp. M1]|nr:hypothetical protein CO655_14790 [Rhizobium sp. M1]
MPLDRAPTQAESGSSPRRIRSATVDVAQGLFRRSAHTHMNTGSDFRGRPTIVPLFFKPSK